MTDVHTYTGYQHLSLVGIMPSLQFLPGMAANDPLRKFAPAMLMTSQVSLLPRFASLIRRKIPCSIA